MTSIPSTYDGALARNADPLLRAYLERSDEIAAEDLLTDLIREEAMPVIKRIVRLRFRGLGAATDAREAHDVDDICNDVLLQVVRRLRRARKVNDEEPIASFRAYVATAAYRGCDAYLREKHPERYRLRNRVQYLVSHHPDFFLRRDDDDCWTCGTKDMETAGERSERLAHVRAAEVIAGAGDPLATERLADTLGNVFRAVGGPLRIEALISFLMSLTETCVATSEEAAAEVADPRGDVDVTLEQQSYLARLWAEVQLLPRGQRVALLFNLRGANGDEALSLLPLIGIASVKQIATAVELAEVEFASLWNDLPWDDLRIASFLGLTRQQVINLRKSARERLVRRMR